MTVDVRAKLVETLNSCYLQSRMHGSGKTTTFLKEKIRHTTEFAWYPCQVISDAEYAQVMHWLRKWPIHPGYFEWDVDWRAIEPEKVTCRDCAGSGKFRCGTECWYCGGRGYLVRAARGMNWREVELPRTEASSRRAD